MNERTGPRLSRIALTGVVVIGVGLVEAIVGAVASPAMAMPHHGPSPDHLLAFIGMVLVLVGVIRSARPGPAPHADRTTNQEDRDAVR
jgi:hypothetical protein